MNAMPNVQPTTFKEFDAYGYRLCPIIPPNAPISERSSLASRVGIPGKDPRGKAPGVRGAQGNWFGFDWLAHDGDAEDFARWQGMGAGIGIKTGRVPGTDLWLIAIDADTTSEEHARTIKEKVEERFGCSLPIRIGRYPKALYLIICEGEFRYTRVEFGPYTPDEKGRMRQTERVELLSDGKQFVAHGVHPVTREHYYWPRAIVPLDDLPRTTPDALLELLEALRAVLPDAKPIVREGAASDVNQASLRGTLDLVRKAVEAIPNTSEIFPTREDYVTFGYAVKAALPDDERAAFRIFDEWSDRWENGENKDGFAEGEWRRMKPSFKVGAPKLYELADKHGGGKFNIGEVWFEIITPEKEAEIDALLASYAAARAEAEIAATPAIEWFSTKDLIGVTPRVREWEIEGIIPKGETTLFYGTGGVGKSLAIQQYATAAAAGLAWLGQPTRPARVMCFFCEDDRDEIHRRQIDINEAVGTTLEATADTLRIACRRYMENLLAVWDRSTGRMKRQAVWELLRRDALAFGATVIILDTLSDIFAGDEVDRAQVTAFVKTCLGRLQQETGATLIVLAHPSQSGINSGSGTSGSTAWGNAVRSHIYFHYPDEDNKPGRRNGAGKMNKRTDVRVLEGMKINGGKPGWEIKVRWAKGAFTLVQSAGRLVSADKADPALVRAPVEIANPKDSLEALVLSAVALLPDEPMTKAPTSHKYAPKVIKDRDPEGTLADYSQREIADAFFRLEIAKRIRPEVVGRDPSRRALWGFRVSAHRLDKLSESEVQAGVFG